jgi:hypothetical protein
MTPPSEAPAGPAIEAARPKDFVASDHAYEIARGVRGCTTDEQYIDLLWRIDRTLLSLHAQNERLLERLRDYVIFSSEEDPRFGMCGECRREWSDGVERHKDDCLAALTPKDQP